MARREVNKKAIIKAVSEKVSANILASDIGSETSISYLVSLIYKPQGYEFRHLGIDYGYGWTKDGGRTYAIKDSDLFDVLDQVSQNLSGKRELDFSKYNDMVVGLPYNLQFTIRDYNSTPDL